MFTRSEVSDFSHKKGRVGVLSFTGFLVRVCVFCLFTPFLSKLFVFQRKNLVLFHLINRLVQVGESYFYE